MTQWKKTLFINQLCFNLTSIWSNQNLLNKLKTSFWIRLNLQTDKIQFTFVYFYFIYVLLDIIIKLLMKKNTKRSCCFDGHRTSVHFECIQWLHASCINNRQYTTKRVTIFQCCLTLSPFATCGDWNNFWNFYIQNIFKILMAKIL